MSFGLACKTFFRILGNRSFAEAVRGIDKSTSAPEPEAVTAPAGVSGRNDAIQLLAVLQREARLVDFLKEDISSYPDAQVGAAVRDVHRESAAALERMFALKPLTGQEEGSDMSVDDTYDPARWKLSGKVGGQPPYRGTLRHPGWQATTTSLPAWKGSDASRDIVAPAELDVR